MKQDGFRLVVRGMSEGDGSGSAFRCNASKKPVPRLAGRFLGGTAWPPGKRGNVSRTYVQLEPGVARKVAHSFLFAPALRSKADSMVEIRGLDVDPKVPTAALQEQQEAR
jgi:hypothetical protein